MRKYGGGNLIFCGFGFCGSKHCGDYVATDVSSISGVTVKSAVYDELFISKNKDYAYTNEISQTWDFDTILHALFNGNLHAGNVDFTVSQVSKIRIKRRKMNSYNWITLFEVPIDSADDFDFERIDRFARSNIEYEYALVPVLGGAEGNLNINSVKSSFGGIYLMEKESGYGSDLETTLSVNKNRPNSIVNTLGRKMPYVITNGLNNYYSGQVSTIFINQDQQTCDLDTEHGWEYRDSILDFLCDGNPKILKHEDGRMWMVQVTDTPSESESPHPDFPTTTFDWVEIGSVDSTNDLYSNNFIDVNVEGS